MKCLIYFGLRDVSKRMFLLFFLPLKYYNIESYMFLRYFGRNNESQLKLCSSLQHVSILESDYFQFNKHLCVQANYRFYSRKNTHFGRLPTKNRLRIQTDCFHPISIKFLARNCSNLNVGTKYRSTISISRNIHNCLSRTLLGSSTDS